MSTFPLGEVPQTVFDLIESHDGLDVCISQPVMDEVAEVLARKFEWTEADLDGFLPPLWRRCLIVAPTIAVKLCDDPDDNCILECAQASAARFIVTGDDDLLRIGQFGSAEIVTPRDFVDAHELS